MTYDIEKLKDTLLPMDVVEYLDIPIRKSGSNFFIECPDHIKNLGKEDINLEHCVLGNSFDLAYYCYSCGGKGNCFDLIAGNQNLDIRKDFVKILKIACNCCGLEQDFLISDSYFYKDFSQDEQLKLDKNDLAKIGLSMTKNRTISEFWDTDETADRAEQCVDFKYFDDFGFPMKYFIFKEKGEQLNLDTIYKNDYNLYVHLIKSKALFVMNFYKEKLLMDYTKFNLDIPENELNSFVWKFKNMLKQKYIDAGSIFKLFASDKEITEIDNSFL